MHLQKFLHLPSTRQRNDGHHENQFETSVSLVIFPTPELKVLSLHKERFCKTAALALVFSASLIGGQLLSPQFAQAKPSVEKPVGTWGRTTASASYIRIRPGTQSPVVAKVPRGMQIMVWGTFDGWYRVETTDHKFGWMRHNTVKVARAGKLKELSHSKAKQASDRTGNQVLYGKPAQLKKYHAVYKAPGAIKGLNKQGVSLAQTPKGAPAKARVVKAPERKPVAAMPRVISITTAEPEKKAAVVMASVQKPKEAKPVVATVSSTPVKPVKATVTVTRTVKVKRRAPQQQRKAPQKAEQLQATITASDIMNARQTYLNNQLGSRRKTSPAQTKSSASSTIKTAPAGKVIQPRVQPMSSRGNPNALNSQPRPIYAKAKVAPTKTAKVAPSRGGSPRDYARMATGDGKFGNGMASQALTYRGMPYISGASSPKRGFDCSGLIYYLLRSRGYNPPRTAAGFASYGKSVPRNQLKAGDLVLFANTYKRGVSHIGVYTGNNNFVHAANSRSGVKTDSLSSGYYAKKYYGARRVK